MFVVVVILVETLQKLAMLSYNTNTHSRDSVIHESVLGSLRLFFLHTAFRADTPTRYLTITSFWLLG